MVSLASGAFVSVLLALAVSANEPLSRSAWVMLCVLVVCLVSRRVSFPSGLVGVQLKPASVGLSVTVTLCSVTLPALVAVSVYRSEERRVGKEGGLRSSVLHSVSLAVGLA